jgi:hypothetical protein
VDGKPCPDCESSYQEWIANPEKVKANKPASTPDIAGQCKALRAVESSGHDGVTTSWYRNPDGPKAADTLERQAAEIEGLRGALEEADARIGVMTGRGERCPQCADTKRNCANAIAAITVDYNRTRAALTGEDAATLGLSGKTQTDARTRVDHA